MYIETGMVGGVSTVDRKHNKYKQFLFGEILRKKGHAIELKTSKGSEHFVCIHEYQEDR
jgi:hypothetical protein